MILEGEEFVQGFLTECDGINSEGTPRATQKLRGAPRLIPTNEVNALIAQMNSWTGHITYYRSKLR